MYCTMKKNIKKNKQNYDKTEKKRKIYKLNKIQINCLEPTNVYNSLFMFMLTSNKLKYLYDFFLFK